MLSFHMSDIGQNAWPSLLTVWHCRFSLWLLLSGRIPAAEFLLAHYMQLAWKKRWEWHSFRKRGFQGHHDSGKRDSR
ncbi:hypothetical protein BO99DRAFT_39553 [Aspergillus violaceofuscus CBS 115571]|uniref:Uncharacterized protein n=1 Tax=Aspergillus violaceofuscus (strain CBS 115571) TaxID=1450538 RepID=A0A2V5GX66_ASPV1|nr:hypothetical protein BO99DRAFT_39553 [Aspergillus violaceofuscus CBS 115571]